MRHQDQADDQDSGNQEDDQELADQLDDPKREVNRSLDTVEL
jgi:hypothetical protein